MTLTKSVTPDRFAASAFVAEASSYCELFICAKMTRCELEIAQNCPRALFVRSFIVYALVVDC